jgi:hypothetical protein
MRSFARRFDFWVAPSFLRLHLFKNSRLLTTNSHLMMPGTNPYTAQASAELDREIHAHLVGDSSAEEIPAYSSSERAADRLRRWLKSEYGTSITTGKTRIKVKPYFARYGTDPSTSTEVLAETYPLSICRLALLLISRDS